MNTPTVPSEREAVHQALRRAYNLGQTYWQQADSEYTSQHKKANTTALMFKTLVAETLEALAPPPPSAVEPVAWMTDDGRVSTDKTKTSCMPKAASMSFCIPLYTQPPPAEVVRLTKDAAWNIAQRIYGESNRMAIQEPSMLFTPSEFVRFFEIASKDYTAIHAKAAAKGGE